LTSHDADIQNNRTPFTELNVDDKPNLISTLSHPRANRPGTAGINPIMQRARIRLAVRCRSAFESPHYPQNVQSCPPPMSNAGASPMEMTVALYAASIRSGLASPARNSLVSTALPAPSGITRQRTPHPVEPHNSNQLSSTDATSVGVVAGQSQRVCTSKAVHGAPTGLVSS
jgi:hypothetical protein